MYGYIYKTTNLINNKIYIGQKKSEYFIESYKGSGKYLKSAINKYGCDNFLTEVIEWCETKQKLDERECYWIEYYYQNNYLMYNIAKGAVGGDTYYGLSKQDRQRRIENLKHNGYFTKETIKQRQQRIQNTVNTRKQNGSYTWTQEQKEAQSKRLKGRALSEETKQKLRDANIGKTLSVEHKYKIGQSNKGKVLTHEQRDNVSKGLKKYYETHDNHFKGKHHTQETKDKIREKCGQNTRNTIWINNGIVNKRVTEKDLQQYLQQGYTKGRCNYVYTKKGVPRKPLSDATKQKISNSNKGKHKITEEQRQLMQQKQREKQTGTVRMIKDGKYKHVKIEDIDNYKQQGYEVSKRSKINKGK